MAYKIAIASGKGGTGKTTVSVNLFYFLQDKITKNILLVDCDVEEPNDSLFFPEAKIIQKEKINQLIPEIDKEKCAYCRKCVEYCEFNAIVIIPHVHFSEVNESLCHSCGACKLACENNAIIEKHLSIGEVIKYNNGLIEGKLKIGSAMQTLLIKELKKSIQDDPDILIYDAPPGTSCPVVETVIDAHYVILVTEPTPFGLYDLKLTIALLEKLEKPFGVIINKAGLGNNEVYKFLEEEKIEILAEIPFNQDYAHKYASGLILNDIPDEVIAQYKEIIEKLEKRILVYEGDNYFKW
ncbi:AAA family ATPase [Bacteroidota bacterium]